MKISGVNTFWQSGDEEEFLCHVHLVLIGWRLRRHPIKMAFGFGAILSKWPSPSAPSYQNEEICRKAANFLVLIESIVKMTI